MKFKVVAADPLGHACRALVVGSFEQDCEAPVLKRFDGALGGGLSRW
jgi:hypothetical protein